MAVNCGRPGLGVHETDKCGPEEAAFGALVREIARQADRCALLEIASAIFGYTSTRPRPSAPP
jgi:hypothetical protein